MAGKVRAVELDITLVQGLIHLLLATIVDRLTKYRYGIPPVSIPDAAIDSGEQGMIYWKSYEEALQLLRPFSIPFLPKYEELQYVSMCGPSLG